MRLSVIIPVYNVAPYLRRCLDSICAAVDRLNDASSVEIICIDDGSTDDSSVILDEYAKRNSRIRVKRQANQGLSAARNAGLDTATGEWIAFIDSDDWVEADYFTALFDAAERGCAKIASELTGDCSATDYWCSNTANVAVAWGKIYHAGLWDGLRFLVGRLHEDEFTTHKAVFKAGFVAGTERRLYHYEKREGSIMSSESDKSMQDWLDALTGQAEHLKQFGERAYAQALAKKIQVEHWCGRVADEDVAEYAKAMRGHVGDYYWAEHYRHPLLANRLSWQVVKFCKWLCRCRDRAWDYPVDMVYCWCNGNDPEFIALKRKYGGSEEKCRFSDNGELEYSIRSVERYAPWVRRIWVVVNDCSAMPDFLSSNPRVTVVRHSEIIPEEMLPTFNAYAIEFYLHRIPGLSEHFIYANDDMFIGREVGKRFFFDAKGRMVCRYGLGSLRALAESEAGSFAKVVANGRKMLGVDNDRVTHHCMDGYLKSVFDDFCGRFKDEVAASTRQRFRSADQLQRDVVSVWAMKTGRGVCRRTWRSRLLRLFGLPRWDSMVYAISCPWYHDTIKRHRPSLFCLNDGEDATDDDRRRCTEFLKEFFK